MELFEYIIIPVISLIVLFIITKLMGYRQVSQLNMYDYINGITIGSIASELVMGGYDKMLRPLMAMIVYALVIVSLSKLASNSSKLRKVIDGEAVVLFDHDYIYNHELAKAKLDIDEFLMQCRLAGYFNLSELQTVVLETNGSLSFFPKEKYRPTVFNDLNLPIKKKELPIVLVKEGQVQTNGLQQSNHDLKWLDQELRVKKINLNEVILMYQEDNSNLIIYCVNDQEKKFK